LKIKKIKIKPLDLVLGVLILAGAFWLFNRIAVTLHYKWEWSALPQYLLRYDEASGRWTPNMLLQGLITTIRLSFWGTIAATIIGAFMGVLRVSRSPVNRLLSGFYVGVVRNLPPLVLVFIFYYFMSGYITASLGIDAFIASSSEATRTVLAFLFAPPALFSMFLSALVTLAVFEGAYITEIVRAGIQSIEKGQWEASYALGLSRFQQMRYIILPLTIQRILPPLAGQFISTIKDSAIVSVISIPELTFQGMELMSATYLTFEIWITITLLYMVLTLSLSLLVERLEIYLRRAEA
jgi:polar amino acid transport system permease protein